MRPGHGTFDCSRLAMELAKNADKDMYNPVIALCEFASVLFS